ncbi:MAG: hypothetical protein ACOCP1_01545 [Campylobacterales bacterium]
MLEDMLKNRELREILSAHCADLMEFMLENDINFSLVCDVNRVSFDPELPSDIKNAFKQFSVFVLAGYTFESAELDDDYIYFEAGFGAENIGSHVSIPLGAILNIVVDDSVVFINPAATIKVQGDDEGVEHSLSALLSNPENKKFLK